LAQKKETGGLAEEDADNIAGAVFKGFPFSDNNFIAAVGPVRFAVVLPINAE
jgi:hypothetical protein